MTAIAATALALAFGCEEGYGGGTQEGQDQQAQQDEQQAREQEQQAQQEEQQAREQEQQAQQEEQQAQREQEQAQREEQRAQREQGGEVGTSFNQAPEEQPIEEQEPLAQAPQQRQQQMRQQQMQQGQMGQQAQSPGQIVTETSERNFNQTISQLQRQMRQNDLELVGQIRYDERQRQRMMREMQGQEQGRQAMGGQQGQQQQAMGGQQQGQQAQSGEIGDVRLLVFRRPDAEMMSIEHQGAESLLDAPRTVLVYERGEDVIVAYRAPQETAAIGTEEPTSELLARVVRNATQPSQQQPTAMRETERETQISQVERERRSGQGEQQQGDMDVSAEDQRQARASQPGRDTQAQN